MQTGGSCLTTGPAARPRAITGAWVRRDQYGTRRMTVREVCDVIEVGTARPRVFVDRCGLHTGDPDDDVRCVLVALTVTGSV